MRFLADKSFCVRKLVKISKKAGISALMSVSFPVDWCYFAHKIL